MRYKFSRSTTPFLFITLVYLSGCTKKISLFPPPGSSIPCRISYIILAHGQFNGPDTLTYTYNSAGDPIFVEQASSGWPNLTFIYDSHNRLVQVKQNYAVSSAVEWATYEFANGSDQLPFEDLTYYNADPDTGAIPPPFYSAVDTSVYQYDPLNRVSQVKQMIGDFGEPQLSPTIVATNYTYNSQGNLTSAIGNGDTVTYTTWDDKVNFHRLSPVFQFIDRDYSQNNSTSSVQIYSYNEYGLPTHLKSLSTNNGAALFLGTGLGECWIQYDCSCGIKTTLPMKSMESSSKDY